MLNVETAYQFLGFFSFIVVVILSLIWVHLINLLNNKHFEGGNNVIKESILTND